MLIPAYLRFADGTSIENQGYRATVSGDVARIEIRFPAQRAGFAVLEFPINVSGVSAPGRQAHPEEWTGAAGALIGKSFRVDLQVP